jgi:hypothetical protein
MSESDEDGSSTSPLSSVMQPLKKVGRVISDGYYGPTYMPSDTGAGFIPDPSGSGS